MFGVRNRARNFFLDMHPNEKKLSVVEDIAAGLAGGWACALVANPVEQIKSRLQVQCTL